MSDELSELLERFPAVSLAELDERAALLRRVDNKYAVRRGSLPELAPMLRDDHEVLEIDDRRQFAYRTTYFETPDLRCFVDHVEGHVPRFKVRTRVYEDSGDCVFEVKLKRGDGETDKRQLEYDVGDSERLTAAARECLDEALREAGLDVPDELGAGLRTSFRRITLAARGGSERLTCDDGVRLSSPHGRAAEQHPDLVLVETKTENGDGPADRALARIGVEPISLSKYRVGMSLVADTPGYGPQPGSELFDSTPTTSTNRRN
jgi:VTC domain